MSAGDLFHFFHLFPGCGAGARDRVCGKSSPVVIPAKGRPAKYYFAGTPKAGIQADSVPGPPPVWTPAFAGVTEGAAGCEEGGA